MSNLEKTLSIIKPDAVERNLSDEIKNIFKKNKLSIIDSKKNHNSNDIETITVDEVYDLI